MTTNGKRTCSAKDLFGQDLFGQGPVWPRTCSAKDLFGQGPVRPRTCSAKAPVRPRTCSAKAPVRPRTCSAKDLFGQGPVRPQQRCRGAVPTNPLETCYMGAVPTNPLEQCYISDFLCCRLTFQALPYPAGGRGSLKLWPELPSPTGEGNGRVAALCAQLRSNPRMGEG